MKKKELLKRIEALEAIIQTENAAVDKFAELKEAYKNGDVIECLQNDGEWFEIKDPKWQTGCEYRIKPIEDPLKVGDVCKFWADDEDIFEINILSDINITKKEFPYRTKQGVSYKNAKKLTKEEVIELLFNK